MRGLAQFGMGLFGLALAVPAWAQSVPANSGAADRMDAVRAEAPAAVPTASGHDHKGLFGWRHCTECQRARAKARDGVDVPPPPAGAVPPGVVMTGPGPALTLSPAPGAVVVPGHNHAHEHSAPGVIVSHVQEGSCAACEQAAGTIVEGPAVVVDPSAPGYASVGGPSAPGYASVGGLGAPGRASAGGGAPPSPIGVARAHNGPAGANPGRGGFAAHDSAVTPTSASIPAAPTPMGDVGPTRPHVLGHLFGVSGMMRDHREWRGRKAQKERERHAAIAYDEAPQAVTELPASVVYDAAGGHGR